MGFKENMLKKIEIDDLAVQVANSVKPQTDAAKFDKAAARRLLEMGGFPHVVLKERDLELYILEDDGEKKKIIVLDNGLAIYDTTIDDVAMRKSPTVKEMISIRNARKILTDSDVLVSKRTDSVRTVKKLLIGQLDLTYTDDDIARIGYEGAASLEGKDLDGVRESLTLFGEILGFQNAPKLFQSAHCKIKGELGKDAAGETQFGPAVIFDEANDSLRFIASPVDSRRKDDLIYYRTILDNEVPADAEGIEVFRRLRQLVLDRKPVLAEA